MRRRIYKKEYLHNRYFVPTYYCYLRGCTNPEHRFHMCEKHLLLLKGATK